MDKLKIKISLLLLLEVFCFILMKSRLIDKSILGFVVFLTFVAIPIALYLYTKDLLDELNSSTQFTTSSKRVQLRLLAAVPFLVFILMIGGFGSGVIAITIQKFTYESFIQDPLSLIIVILFGLIFFYGSIKMCRNLYGSSNIISPAIWFKSNYYAEALTNDSIVGRDFHSWFIRELNDIGYTPIEKGAIEGYILKLSDLKTTHSINFFFAYTDPDIDFDIVDYENEDHDNSLSEDIEFYITLVTKKRRLNFAKGSIEEQTHNKLYRECSKIVESNPNIEILMLDKS